jgi:hypothetical protein
MDPLNVDLAPYSGAKWSLFYHPRYVTVAARVQHERRSARVQ